MLILLACFLTQLTSAVDASQLPSVNLGYATYRATELNVAGGYYNFSNIRYAAPPLGSLRFADPAPPLVQDEVQDGTVGYICPQSFTGYWRVAERGLGNLAKFLPDVPPTQSQSEDCLFLDVMAPTEVFDGARRDPAKLSPVLVHIHGGGFFFGDKRAVYDPRGLLRESGNAMIYVSVQYRLGALGFLTGLEKSAENATSPNAGLLDQRYALKWVQQHIHLFGGDAKQVTILGQSAGGGSVEYHTVAYGGSKPEENSLFARAIAQSPAPIIVEPKWQTFGANLLLESAGVSSVDELRRLPTEQLQAAQQKAHDPAPYVLEYFSPTIDGDLIPDLPRRLYKQGRFIKGIDVMTSHTANEGRLFTNLSLATDEDYNDYILTNFPSASPDILSYITQKLYPSSAYTSNPLRQANTFQEFNIACNTLAIARAYGGQSWNYEFDVKPAIHSQDLYYTWFVGENDGIADPKIAGELQKGLVRFVMGGDPNGEGDAQGQRKSGGAGVRWPRFGSESNVAKFTEKGLEVAKAAVDNERCDWWLQGLYTPTVQEDEGVVVTTF